MEAAQAEESNAGETSGHETNMTYTGKQEHLVVRMNFNTSKRCSSRKNATKEILAIAKTAADWCTIVNTT